MIPVQEESEVMISWNPLEMGLKMASLRVGCALGSDVPAGEWHLKDHAHFGYINAFQTTNLKLKLGFATLI